jgi:hypothetical protein
MVEAAAALDAREDGMVVIAPERPLYAHGVRRDVPLAISRRNGLLLRSVSFWPRPSHTANDAY